MTPTRTWLLAVATGLLVLTIGCAAAQTTSGARAWLSWSESRLQRDIPPPPPRAPRELPEGAEECGVVRACYVSHLHLNVVTPQPLDSLGFELCWLADDPRTTVKVICQSLEEAGAGLSLVPGDQVADTTGFQPHPRWRSSGEWLAEIGRQDEAGDWHYRLRFELEIRHGGALRFTAERLTGRTTSGEILQMGVPEALIGEGWRLQPTPLITTVSGRLNKRFIRSRLTLHGVHLDRLVSLWLVDSSGKMALPSRTEAYSARRLDVHFTNSAVGEGRCDLVYTGPDGTVHRLAEAVLAGYLTGAGPGDTDLGIKPGRDR